MYTKLVIVLLLLLAIWLLWKNPGQLPIELSSRKEGLSTTEVQSTEEVKPTAESTDMLERLRRAVIPLMPEKLSKLQFMEGNNTRIDDKTIVYLCLRDQTTGKLYKWNDLVYVTLHECAHAVSVGYDPEHVTPEFQNNFKTLLRKAESAGIYKPQEAFVQEYCNLQIDPKDPGIMIR